MEHIATIRRRRRRGGTVEWIARLIYEDAETGRRKELSRSAPSPKEARRQLKELEEDFMDRGVAAIGADEMKFSALVTHCKEKRYCEPIYDGDGRKLAGVRGRRTFLSHLRVLENYFGQMQLRSINVASIRAYRLARLQEKTKKGTLRSITTVNRELSTLRAMLNEAIVNDWLKFNPFRRVRPGELISAADERKRTTVISFAEEARLLAECDGEYKRHLKALLIGLLDTGVRRGELFNVRRSDIHFDLDEMIVTSYKGKTVQRRPVPLTPRFKTALLDILETPGVATFKTGRNSKIKPDKDLVFGVQWTIQRSWEDVRRAANLTHVRLHDLRHTAATRLASRLSITEVGLILGHSDPRTTHRYVNRTPEVVREAGRIMHELQMEYQKRAEAEVRQQSNAVN